MRIALDMVAGRQHHKSKYGTIEVIESISPIEVKIIFLDSGFITTAHPEKIRAGTIADVNFPCVYGVGFIGSGRYQSGDGSRNCRAYEMWRGLLQVCYSVAYLEKSDTYKSCTVCEDWHNYQNFCAWYEQELLTSTADMVIDKQAVLNGSKVFGSDSCILISTSEHISKRVAPNKKSYMFTNPESKKVTVDDLKAFCSENGLKYASMLNVNSNVTKKHKGWTKA